MNALVFRPAGPSLVPPQPGRLRVGTCYSCMCPVQGSTVKGEGYDGYEVINPMYPKVLQAAYNL